MKIRRSTSGVWPQLLVWAAILVPVSATAQTSSIRQWQYLPGADGESCELGLREVATPELGPGEVQVRIRAASLNGRDRGRLNGSCRPGADGEVQIPLSDGAGEVSAVGAAARHGGATRIHRGRPGDQHFRG